VNGGEPGCQSEPGDIDTSNRLLRDLNVLPLNEADAPAPLRILEFDAQPVAGLFEHANGRASRERLQRSACLFRANVDRRRRDRERRRPDGRGHRAGGGRRGVDGGTFAWRRCSRRHGDRVLTGEGREAEKQDAEYGAGGETWSGHDRVRREFRPPGPESARFLYRT